MSKGGQFEDSKIPSDASHLDLLKPQSETDSSLSSTLKMSEQPQTNGNGASPQPEQTGQGSGSASPAPAPKKGSPNDFLKGERMNDRQQRTITQFINILDSLDIFDSAIHSGVIGKSVTVRLNSGIDYKGQHQREGRAVSLSFHNLSLSLLAHHLSLFH